MRWLVMSQSNPVTLRGGMLLSLCDLFYNGIRAYRLPTTELNGTSIIEDDETSFDRAQGGPKPRIRLAL